MMKKIQFYFAVIGWITALSAHSLSLAHIDVSATIPYIWILHIGIFLVWLPVVLELGNNQEIQRYKHFGSQNTMYH